MITTYRDIRDSLKTGDIVLFSGKGGVSEWIKWFTRSGWSHVGMVVRLDDWNMVLLWESTTLSNLKDVELGRENRGVQLVGLSDRLRSYNGDVAIRQLNKAVDDDKREALGVFRSSVAGRPYEESKLELLRSAADLILPENEEDLSSLFCSELVAESYQVMGLLGEEKPSNEYTPSDFGSVAKEPLALQGGFKLGEETRVASA